MIIKINDIQLRFRIWCTLLLLFITTATRATPENEIIAALNKWTAAFNHRQVNATCALFSKRVRATYQYYPERTYSEICSGFKKIFADHKKAYHYQFHIKKIYPCDNLAAVRLQWQLNIYQNKKLIETTIDEGLDVFIKENNRWVIINYLAFPIEEKNKK